jgi:AAA family ATP:ADP antiporter
MLKRILLLLNIKPSEANLVKDLFFVQFALGVATAFLYTASLTLFLSAFSINNLPKVFIVSAMLILMFNKAYAYFEKKYEASGLLQLVVVFSMVSTVIFWVFLKLYSHHWLILLLAAWNALVYMLIGYAFWGMSALLFNVRESKRVFSIVGSGDIPAKMLGYLFVSVLVHFTDIINLLWIPVASLFCCYFLIKKLQKRVHLHGHAAHATPLNEHTTDQGSVGRMIVRMFHSKLVLLISLVSLIAYIIFLFVDFTFLSEIKVKYHHQEELASFIAVFFAGGRVFAILIKVLLSSRMISRIGLLNSLMITPLLLLVINGIVIFSNGPADAHLYIFGCMVLLIEVLRSSVQEPVFFILFQPLKPHDRLRGHLIAKGYTFPVALLAVGIFLLFYLQNNPDISIVFLSKAMFTFLILWIGVVFLIRHQYIDTLIASLKRGIFTGSELFLNDEEVFTLLIKKAESSKPQEVINALNLLERSRYTGIFSILLTQLQHNPSEQVREYVLDRVISNQMTSALPILHKQLKQPEMVTPSLFKALFCLESTDLQGWKERLAGLTPVQKRAALIGLSSRKEEKILDLLNSELEKLCNSSDPEEVKIALDVMQHSQGIKYTELLKKLLTHPAPGVARKAIETCGKVKDFSLFDDIFNLSVPGNFYFSMEKALSDYGDIVFGENFIPSKTFSERTLYHIIKAAARVKGPRSDEFLFSLFHREINRQDAIIDALWKKKADINVHRHAIEEWLRVRLHHMKNKVDTYFNINLHQPAHLLSDALVSELRENMETVLKACALLYNREQIDQFLNVYKLENTTRVANAIELLEMTIPKKHFAGILYFIELSIDLQHNQLMALPKKETELHHLILEVVTNKKAGFNAWSRSVALYLLPKLLNREAALVIASNPVAKEEQLVQETRNYVLSILK